MPLSLKPIGDYLNEKDTLKRVPSELIPLAGNPMPWTGYLAFVGRDKLVGVCAFKEEPDRWKRVEIAYFTFPEYERNGYATAMARGLVDIAMGSKEATAVIAHTLRKENASARICRRLGFDCKGEVMDPEDGMVWRWRLPV